MIRASLWWHSDKLIYALYSIYVISVLLCGKCVILLFSKLKLNLRFVSRQEYIIDLRVGSFDFWPHNNSIAWPARTSNRIAPATVIHIFLKLFVTSVYQTQPYSWVSSRVNQRCDVFPPQVRTLIKLSHQISLTLKTGSLNMQRGILWGCGTEEGFQMECDSGAKLNQTGEMMDWVWGKGTDEGMNWMKNE